MRVREYLSDTFVSILEARSDVIALGWEIRDYRDYEDFRGSQAFLAYIGPGRRIAPNDKKHEFSVDLRIMSQRDEDLKGYKLNDGLAVCDDVIQEYLSFFNNGVATLQADLDALYPASGITIDGIVQTEGEDMGEDIYGHTSTANVYLTYEKP